MKKSLLTIGLSFMAVLIQTSLFAQTDLFFSEYIEGSSFNKALELYNGTGNAIDLSAENYVIQMYFNGNTTAGTTISLSGTVASGDVFVLANQNSSSPSDSALIAQADQISFASFFNGDDAIELRKGGPGGQLLDVIGQVGVDPGSEWGSGNTSTQDNTLRRLPAFCNGDTNPDDAFDPAAEWEGFANNTYDGIGSHTATCSGSPSGPTIVINEFDADQSGTDANEFIELFDGGAGNTSLDGLVIVLYNGTNDLVYNAIDLDGNSTDAAGYFVIASSLVPNVDLVSFTTDGIQNGADAIALYEGDAADFPNTASVTTDNLIDAVVYGTNDADDAGLLALLNSGQPQLDDDATNSLQRIPNGSGGLRNTQSFMTLPPTPGEVNEEITTITEAFIHEVQGSGTASPLLGQMVTIEGIVVGDYQEDATSINGFFVQEEDADADANPQTSEGIFVFEGSYSVDVAVGDLVRVTGTVDEYFNLTELTDITEVVVVLSGNALPSSSTITLPFPDENYLEAFEGMAVTLPQTLTITNNYLLGRGGEFEVTAGNVLPQPTQIAEPGTEAAEVLQQNNLNRITVDDGKLSQNPDPEIYPTPKLTAENSLRTGDQVADIQGVLTYSWSGFSGTDAYRIHPSTTPTFIEANPRTEAPAPVDGDLKVVSFNVLNYFTTLDQNGNTTPTGLDPRGANTAEEFERQRAKIIEALYTIDADVAGLLEIENNESESLQNLVDGLNARYGETTYDFINTGIIGTDAIKVALIYKTATVTPTQDFALLDSSVDPRFIDTRNRPTLAQSFSTESGAVFTVAVNHLKSKGSGCGIGDDDAQQGNCNGTRTQAAEALVDWLATDPTNVNNDKYVLLGDFNSYAMEDPVQAILDAGYVNLGAAFAAEDEFVYSYQFDGQFGTLDYAFASPSFYQNITGATEWHINADEPTVLDYNVEFKTANQVTLFYNNEPYRASDHDPIIAGFSFNKKPGLGSIIPDQEIELGETIQLNLSQYFTGNPTQYAVQPGRFADTALPDYITLDEDSGMLIIQPTDNSEAGIYNLVVTASNDYGDTSTVFQLKVNLDLPESLLTLAGVYKSGAEFDEGGAEIPAYDAVNQRIYYVNGFAQTVDVLDASDVNNPVLLESIDLSKYGATPNSVDVYNGLVAVAVENDDKQAPGTIVLLTEKNKKIEVVQTYQVGALPDMVTFTPDGTKILVANEGEPNGDYTNDPEGSVSIIDLKKSNKNKAVTQVGFTNFNGQKSNLQAAGLRFPSPAGTSVAQDLEPEYISVSNDGKYAFVTLQENNALAKIDIAKAKVIALLSLGYKDHSLFANLLDASDRDEMINLAAYPNLVGMYQPDAIASFEVNGKTYLVTANEGDARDYDGYAEEERIKDLDLDSTAFPDAEALQEDEYLGRLTVTTANGDTDGDGDFDKLYAFGARSFSIWDDQGNQVYDSGDDLEQVTALLQTENFNADQDENDPDARSDNKGPEPEGIALGQIGEKTFAFIGLERIGGIMVFDVTNPVNPTFTQYINPRDFNIDPQEAVGVGPEGLDFVPQGLSPNGKPLVIVANEVSGDVTIFEAVGVPVVPITLTAVCDDKLPQVQQWLVNNPNGFPIRITYEVMVNNKPKTGSLLLEPGENIFETNKPAKALEAQIQYFNQEGEKITVTANNADCINQGPLSFIYHRDNKWLVFWKVENKEKKDVWFTYKVKETGERFVRKAKSKSETTVITFKIGKKEKYTLAYAYQWQGEYFSGEVVFDKNNQLAARTAASSSNIKSDEELSGALTPEEDSALEVLPNPVRDKATLRIAQQTDSDLLFIIYDLQGRPVYSQQANLKAGVQELSLPMENLKSGVYQLLIQDKKTGTFKSTKIIKD